MVWGCMWATGVGRLFKVEGIMKANQYIGILQNVMLPSITDLFADEQAIFQQDNDPKHVQSTHSQGYHSMAGYTGLDGGDRGATTVTELSTSPPPTSAATSSAKGKPT